MTTRQTVLAAIHDAFALRGLEGGGAFITTADPCRYMTPDRLRLAREALRLLPAGANIAKANDLARDIEPILVAMIQGPARG